MDRKKKIVRTSFLGILTNLLLTVFKAIVGFLANSIAIVLDAINNLSDALSAIVTIVGIKLASKKPDLKHPYGHGRIEYFTSEIIALIIFAAGVAAFRESVIKVFNPVKLNYSYVTIIIIIVAIITKLFLSRRYKRIGKEINSDALYSTGVDAFYDAMLSISTLIAIILHLLFHINIEGYLGIFISLTIIKNSIEILVTNASELIGGRANTNLAKDIKQDISSFPKVLGVYDLILHNYGPANSIGAVNIEVNDKMTAGEIHLLTRKINHEIYEKYSIFLTIGIYASNKSSKKVLKMKELLGSILKKYPEVLDVHGFYIDEDKKTVTFDLIIDFAFDKRKIKNKIVNEMKASYPNYKYRIILDTFYSD